MGGMCNAGTGGCCAEHTPPRVAIIGGGLAGIAALDACLEEGLQPTVFEARSALGGLWGQDPHMKTYDKLACNVSKHLFRFSKMPYAKGVDTFPSKKEVGEYLEQYVERFGLAKFIRLGSPVKQVLRSSDGDGWLVDGVAFNKVIVATGAYHKDKVPEALGLQLKTYSGRVLKMSDFKNAKQGDFTGKRVAVIGSSYSGAEIAKQIALSGEATSVAVTERTSTWFIDHHTEGNGMPYDLVLHRRDYYDGLDLMTTFPFMHAAPAHQKLALCHDVEQVRSCICDGFESLLNQGKLDVLRGDIKSFDGLTLEMADGSKGDFDVLVLAAGFAAELSFLPQDLLESVNYVPQGSIFPVTLAGHVWPNPKTFGPGLAFVCMGSYYTSYMCYAEVQSRWIAAVFSGRVAQSVTQESYEEEAARQLKRAQGGFQFATSLVPEPSLPLYCDGIAKQLGCYPTQILEDPSHPLHKAVRYGPLLTSSFRFQGHGQDVEAATAHAQEVMALFTDQGLDYVAQHSRKEQ